MTLETPSGTRPPRREGKAGETMKGKKRFPLLTILVAVSLAISPAACVSPPSYDYGDIRREYADTLCRLAPLEGGQGDTASCAVNRPVTLESAIEIALANSPDKMMALSRIRSADAAIQRAGAAFYPAVSVYTEYTEGDAPSAYLFKAIDQRKLPPNTNFNDPGKIENFESGIQARINLFNGGRDLLRRRMAETGRTEAELARQEVENGLAASVISAYYNALAARRFIAIARESVTTVESQLRVMNVRFKAGGALKSDILSLDVRLAEARESQVRAENHWKTALIALAEVMGVSPDPPIPLKETSSLSVPVPAGYMEGLTRALARRPELERVRQTVVRSRMALDMARAAYLPRVDLQGKYYLDDESMAYELDRDNWTVGLMVNWDLFTGFSRDAGIREAEAVLEERLSADRKTLLSIKADVKNAYFALDAAEARLKVADASVAAAEESLDLVKAQYEGGSATITRYLEAELDRNRARTRATAAFYDREKARADLARAVGHWATPKDRR